MSWIDNFEQRKAKIESSYDRKVLKEYQSRQKKLDEFHKVLTNAFRGRVKNLLPRGVRIVDTYWGRRNDGDRGGPVVRIDLGCGVQLDLFWPPDWHELPSPTTSSWVYVHYDRHIDLGFSICRRGCLDDSLATCSFAAGFGLNEPLIFEEKLIEAYGKLRGSST